MNINIPVELYDLRNFTFTDNAVRSGVVAGTHVLLAPWIACNAEEFAALPRHEQLRLHAIAAARSTRKAVLISKSAARIHGLWVITSPNEKVELCTPTGKAPERARWPESYEYRYGKIPPNLYREVDGVRLVSRARACVDIARYHGFAAGLVAIDSALRQGLSHEDMLGCLFASGRFKGAATFRRCVEQANVLSESPFESYLRALILECPYLNRVPLQLQARVIPGVRADLLLGRDVVVEVDGAAKYDGHTYGTSAPEVVVQEREREKRIQNAGYRVFRFSPQQLLAKPDYVLQTLRSALGLVEKTG